MIASLLVLGLLAPNEAAARAEAHFSAGEYEQAIDALHDAYAHEPDPAFVFAEGSALQELGRYAEAIEVYERFLALAPPKAQAQTAFQRIQACRAALGEREPDPASEPKPPATTPEPESQPVAEAAPPEPTPRALPPRPWHRDVPGGVLLGVGLSLAATGGVLVGIGAARHGSADEAASEGSFRDDLRGSMTMQGVGIGLAVSGGALLVGSIVRYAIVRRRQPSATSSHAPRLGPPLLRW